MARDVPRGIQRLRRRLGVLLALGLAGATSLANPTDEQALVARVHAFHAWAITYGKAAARFEPRIRQVPGSQRLELDMSSLPAFVARLMRSGHFAPEFADTLTRYYRGHAARIAAMSDPEFAAVARDGRGPLLETEDIDIYFCAQEFEYRPSFVRRMRLTTARIVDGTASAVVSSPYGWETPFRFAKVGQRWLITGYCVFV